MPRLYLTDSEWTEVDFNVVTWHESGLLFTAKKGGTRPRVQPVFSIVQHTSGGETKPQDFFRNISSRPTKDKRGYSSHFYTAVEPKTLRPTVYQMAPCSVITRHAGIMNKVSVGNEIQCRLIEKEAWPTRWKTDFPRGSYAAKIHGRDRSLLMLTADQLEIAVQLTFALCEALEIPLKIPGTTIGKNRTIYDTVIDKPDAYRGVLAHYNCSAGKIDPGTQLFEELKNEDFTCTMKY
jgi:hypothetical protein